jgi:hypothetical protein
LTTLGGEQHVPAGGFQVEVVAALPRPAGLLGSGEVQVAAARGGRNDRHRTGQQPGGVEALERRVAVAVGFDVDIEHVDRWVAGGGGDV